MSINNEGVEGSQSRNERKNQSEPKIIHQTVTKKNKKRKFQFDKTSSDSGKPVKLQK